MNGFEFIFDLPVFTVLQYVLIAILVNVLFKVILTVKEGEFDIKELPRFLGTAVIPFALGLLVLALVANYYGEVWDYIYYATAVAVLAKYIAKIYGHIQELFGVTLESKPDN